MKFPHWLRFKMIQKSSRDNARTPMQWTKDGGFTQGIPWLKVNSNTSTINVENNLTDSNSIYYHYKKLIELRKSNEVLTKGSFKPLYMKRNIFIFSRILGKKSFTTILNISKKKHKIPIILKGKVVLSNYNRTNLNDLVLQPYESILVKKEGAK